jgi:uncharacterized membrane protein YhiD involved in acid resistance
MRSVVVGGVLAHFLFWLVAAGIFVLVAAAIYIFGEPNTTALRVALAAIAAIGFISGAGLTLKPINSAVIRFHLDSELAIISAVGVWAFWTLGVLVMMTSY